MTNLNIMGKSRILGIACCLTIFGATAPSVFAQDTHFKFYGGPAYIAPLSDSNVSLGDVTDSIKAEKQVGWNLGFEARWGDVMGLEVDYVNSTQDVKFGGRTIGETDFSPLTATLNFHLIHTELVDFYFGPSYSFVNWGDIELNADGRNLIDNQDLGTDSARGWGASLGVDIGLGKNFAFTGGLKYLNVDLPLSNRPNIKFNPLVARLGVAVRF